MSDSEGPNPLIGANAVGSTPMVGVYPTDLECDITTSTGATLHMRPIRPDDADELVHFHLNLSSGSIYRRYFAFHPELSEREVEHLTTVDYVDRLAFIIEDDEKLVAVGRYDRIPGTSEAEVAFLVTDEFQNHGLGLLLLKHLADAARQRGITTFTAETQADNRGMLGVFKDSGFPVTSRIEEEVVSVSFPIEPTEKSRARYAGRRTPPKGRAHKSRAIE
ncbi:MAG: GNAT family N-acetyltransferase [Acidimicrobiales bacterium]